MIHEEATNPYGGSWKFNCDDDIFIECMFSSHVPGKGRSNGGGPERTSGGADEGKGGGGAGASSSLVSFPCVLSCSDNIGLSCVFSLLSVLPPSELREGGLTFRLGLLLVA